MQNLSVGQAAKALGVSVDTLRRWDKAGKIQSTRTPGNQRRFVLGQNLPSSPAWIKIANITLTLLAIGLAGVLGMRIQKPTTKEIIHESVLPASTTVTQEAETAISPLASDLNMLFNSSFEAGVADHEPRGWTYILDSGADNTKVSNQSIRTGNYSLKFEKGSPDRLLALGVSQPTTKTINGRSYVYRLHVRTFNLVGNPTLRIGLIGGNAGDVYEDRSLGGTADWTPHSLVYESAALGKYPFIQIMNYQGGTIFVDDVTLSEKIPLTAAILGDAQAYASIANILYQSITKVGDGAVTVDADGNMYPTQGVGIGGSLGKESTRFGGLYSTNVNSSGDGTFSGDVGVNGGDLTTSATTFNLTNSNVTTLNIGSAATTVSLGASSGTVTVNSDLAVNGGDLTSGATTMNLFNSTATTLNIGEAATSINLGSTTGTLTLNNAAFNCTDCINFDDLSDSLSMDAAATITNGTTENLTITLSSTGDFVIEDVASDSSPFIIDEDGNIGMGTTNTTYKVNIGQSTTTAGETIRGIDISSSSFFINGSGTDSFGTATAIDVRPQAKGDGDTAVGLRAIPALENDSDDQYMYGVDVQLGTMGTSDEAYAVRVNDVDANIAGGSAYGVWVDIDDANLTTKYSIYVNSGSANSYFGSSVGIFETSPASGMELDVAGQIQLNLAGAQTSVALCGSHASGGGASVSDVEIVDCTGTPGADYMEMYPTEEGVEPGDVVVPSSNTTNTTTGETIAKLTNAVLPYQNNIIGIVSDPNNAGDFNSIGYNIRPEDRPMPIALSGRVPVKVATSSADIQIGDVITTSEESGRAMKAQRAGKTIGIALEPWTKNSGKNTVLLFVDPGWWQPGLDVAIDSSNNPFTTDGDLSVLGTATLGSTTIAGSLLVDGAVRIDSHGIEGIDGKLRLIGDLSIQGDSIGEAVVPKDATSVTVNSSAVSDNSRIFITPIGETDKPLFVASTSDGSFTVSLSSSASADIKFNWWVIN